MSIINQSMFAPNLNAKNVNLTTKLFIWYSGIFIPMLCTTLPNFLLGPLLGPLLYYHCTDVVVHHRGHVIFVSTWLYPSLLQYIKQPRPFWPLSSPWHKARWREPLLRRLLWDDRVLLPRRLHWPTRMIENNTDQSENQMNALSIL